MLKSMGQNPSDVEILELMAAVDTRDQKCGGGVCGGAVASFHGNDARRYLLLQNGKMCSRTVFFAVFSLKITCWFAQTRPFPWQRYQTMSASPD